MTGRDDKNAVIILTTARDLPAWEIALEGLLHRKKCWRIVYDEKVRQWYRAVGNLIPAADWDDIDGAPIVPPAMTADTIARLQKLGALTLSDGTKLEPNELSVLKLNEMGLDAYSWLLTTVSRELLPVINNTRDPYYARHLLREHLRKSSAITASILKDKMMNKLHMKPVSQGGKTSWLFMNIEDLRDQLIAHGNPADDSELVTAVIRGLPSEFDSATYDYSYRSSKGDKSVTYKYVKDSIEHYEIFIRSRHGQRPKKIETPTQQGDQALYVKDKNKYNKPPPGPCPECGQPGHWKRFCPKLNKNKQRKGTDAQGNRVCYSCQQPGHLAARCPGKTTDSANIGQEAH